MHGREAARDVRDEGNVSAKDYASGVARVSDASLERIGGVGIIDNQDTRCAIGYDGERGLRIQTNSKCSSGSVNLALELRIRRV